jgi:murein DD-endopeptidase MepM/ murein hydrolase activator NlpD
MPPFKLYPTLAIIGIIAIVSVFLAWPKQNPPETPNVANDEVSLPPPYATQASAPQISPTFSTPTESPVSSAPAITPAAFVEPVQDFVQRVTKKPFGLFVDPNNSPVQPERFSGYHTGADAEFADTKVDVPVKSIAEGQVRSARRSNGYGGVVVIEHVINNQPHLVIYGHLDPARSIKENSPVIAGETIGYLGRDKSAQTDGERKHLHLAILSGTKLDLRGYVSNPEELINWLNPLDLYTPLPTP